MARLLFSPNTIVDVYLTTLGWQNFKTFAHNCPTIVKYSDVTSELWCSKSNRYFISTAASVYWGFLRHFSHVNYGLMVDYACVHYAHLSDISDEVPEPPEPPLAPVKGKYTQQEVDTFWEAVATEQNSPQGDAPPFDHTGKVVLDDASLDLFLEAVGNAPNWGLYLFKYNQALEKTDYNTPLDPEMAIPAHRDQLRHILEAFIQAEVDVRTPSVQSIAPDAPEIAPQVPSFSDFLPFIAGNGLHYDLEVSDDKGTDAILSVKGPTARWKNLLVWIRQWKP